MVLVALATLVLVAEFVQRIRSARRYQAERNREERSRKELHLPPYAWNPFLGQVHAARYVSPTCVTDENGFRTRRPVAVPKPLGEIRILLTGGSTAAGAGAPDGETIVDRLQAAFDRTRPAVRATNVAQSAFNSSQELAQISLFLLDLEPDVLILIDGRNDFYFATRPDWQPHITYRMTRFTDWYAAARREALGRGSVATAIVHDATSVLKASSLAVGLARAFRLARTERAQTTADSDVESRVRRAAHIYAENIRRAALLARGSRCQLCVCLQPTLLQTRKRLSVREGEVLQALRTGGLYYIEDVIAHYPLFSAAADAKLVQLSGEYGFSYRNCSSVFDNLGPETEIFLDDGHLTEGGQSILARAVEEAVRLP